MWAKSHFGLRLAIAAPLGLSALAFPWIASASSFEVIGSVGPLQKGSGAGPLAADAAGNLYSNLSTGDGALYELTAASEYTQSTLLSTFGGAVPGGVGTNVPAITSHNIILDLTVGGGVCDGDIVNFGQAASISPVVLHCFTGSSSKPTDGNFPESGVVAGPSLRYYGTTTFGGIGAHGHYEGNGIAYDVSASTTKPFYKVLHRFGGTGDGINPTYGNLAGDNQGRLYGETSGGGANGLGTVFMLEKNANDPGWQEQVILSSGSPGTLSTPVGNVILDAAGNLYGCATGGTHGQGGIFELTPPTQSNGTWAETVLYNFGDHRNDPNTNANDSSACGITMDPKTGLIVGASYGGGTKNYGTIFTLTPPTAGTSAWTEAVGHSFNARGAAGGYPFAPLVEVGGVFYGAGNLTNGVYAFTP